MALLDTQRWAVKQKSSSLSVSAVNSDDHMKDSTEKKKARKIVGNSSSTSQPTK